MFPGRAGEVDHCENAHKNVSYEEKKMLKNKNISGRAGEADHCDNASGGEEEVFC